MGKKPKAPETSPVHQLPAPSFSFDDVDDDEATQRDRFERDIAAPPDQVFDAFATFVWRQNAGVGLHPEYAPSHEDEDDDKRKMGTS